VTRTDGTQPGTAIPEADRLEQKQQADPRMDEQQGWPVLAAEDVDEADRLEQVQEVVGDADEEYAPDQL
jgi:hypothetical protein